ncbi:penicillin acylase family protein [Haliangium sp.]|uniref:penicillin acylase family protein n=1 Tax=Haliangium sp. TaxID=2663208 RepID=UPI003D0A83AF
MRWLRVLLLGALTAAVAYGLGARHGQVPALGAFLSPFSGFWCNGRGDDGVLDDAVVAGLEGPVDVVWDQRRVAHVFAGSSHDLYFVQGYVTARDRLWQMDFVSRVAAGRLAEILGPNLVAHDRFRRRVGMVYGAENVARAVLEEPASRAAIEAYVAGVNAWIDELDRRGAAALPLEYKLLGYRPERWTVLHSMLVAQFMAWSLSKGGRDGALSAVQERLGTEAAERLFPEEQPFLEPVIPAGTALDFAPQALPFGPGGVAPAADEVAPVSDPGEVPAPGTIPASGTVPAPGEPAPINGSNNWAITGARTATGAALLANDPHLSLALPSIWYEIQLTGPDVDVYGVSLPGVPTVIIGFNRDIAWGETNGISDVLDWYRVELRGEDRGEYFYDGAWRPTKIRTEVIRVRGGEDIVDQVVYTHHGPVAYQPGEEPFSHDLPVGAALRWTAHDPSTPLQAFLMLNRADDYAGFVDAVAHHHVPGQNFAYADRGGLVALWHSGRYPLRWPGQGKYLSDGGDPVYDWQGFIPKAHNPHVVAPPRGFVSSANQPPTDASYPYKLGREYAGFARGARINRRLAELSAATPGDMIALQNDNLDLGARKLLPALLAAVDDAALDADGREAVTALQSWDYRHEPDSVAATVYATWRQQLMEAIWDDELPRSEGLVWPSFDVTVALLLDGELPYLDDVNTSASEGLGEVATAALSEAVAELTEAHGPIGEAWQLGRARGTDLRHLARVPGLGREGLFTGGGSAIVNATTRYHGPSWRMVVELGPEVHGWGIYPGGQSGNPGSVHYDDFVDTWVRGELVPLLFLRGPEQERASDQVAGTTRLEPAP